MCLLPVHRCLNPKWSAFLLLIQLIHHHGWRTWIRLYRNTVHLLYLFFSAVIAKELRSTSSSLHTQSTCTDKAQSGKCCLSPLISATWVTKMPGNSSWLQLAYFLQVQWKQEEEFAYLLQIYAALAQVFAHACSKGVVIGGRKGHNLDPGGISSTSCASNWTGTFCKNTRESVHQNVELHHLNDKGKVEGAI
jgi:hypothetical protein